MMLPPPNWSPTGNSGTWEKSPDTNGCWAWKDDALSEEEQNARHSSSAKHKLKWWQKIFRK